ncbi:hypothetical protein D3OALGB2SA_2088 [Olavius algarvensis associated proteobacterium Delta 3]|nr:hypothetical protein D3OALGB2SA_2088 [Olavius algarvensis associated proteobacterium Delta 3]
MNPMRLETVGVDRIDPNTDACRITTKQGIDALADSIREVGLLNAPILAEGPTRYQVVSGYRRVAACRQLDIPGIVVRIMAPEATLLDRAKVTITENLHQRSLNLIELSRAYALLFDATERPDEAVRVAGGLGLPGNLEYMEKTSDLCGMAPVVQRGILSGSITLPMAIELSHLPAAVSEALVALFLNLKLSLNRQRETLRLFREIARRDGIPLADLIDAAVSGLGTRHDERGSAEMSRRLLTHLKRRRYPNIMTTEEEFQRLVHRLRLGEGIKLVPPKHFEGTTYRLEVGFDSPGTLQRRLKRLVGLVDDPGLVRILKRDF